MWSLAINRQALPWIGQAKTEDREGASFRAAVNDGYGSRLSSRSDCGATTTCGLPGRRMAVPTLQRALKPRTVGHDRRKLRFKTPAEADADGAC
jgi:hypothetical protein